MEQVLKANVKRAVSQYHLQASIEIAAIQEFDLTL